METTNFSMWNFSQVIPGNKEKLFYLAIEWDLNLQPSAFKDQCSTNWATKAEQQIVFYVHLINIQHGTTGIYQW